MSKKARSFHGSDGRLRKQVRVVPSTLDLIKRLRPLIAREMDLRILAPNDAVRIAIKEALILVRRAEGKEAEEQGKLDQAIVLSVSPTRVVAVSSSTRDLIKEYRPLLAERLGIERVQMGDAVRHAVKAALATREAVDE